MGHSLAICEDLPPPFQKIDERLNEIPAENRLDVVHKGAPFLFVFLEAQHQVTFADNTRYGVNRGDFLFFPGDSEYSIEALPQASRLQLIRASFDEGGELWEKIPGISESTLAVLNNCFDTRAHVPGKLVPEMMRIATEILWEIEGELTGWRERVYFKMLDVLLLAARFLEEGEKPLKRLPHGSRVSEAVIRYLNDNFRRQLTLDEISWQLRLSPEHATRRFREETGETIFQHLRMIRLIEARNLLVATHRSVEDIAAYVGFQNVNGFHKAFKGKMGMPPGQYRKVRQKDQAQARSRLVHIQPSGKEK